MKYQHRQAVTPGAALAKGRDELQRELDALARARAAAAAERARVERNIEASRARQRRKRARRGPATYKPTAQQLAYQLPHALPEPIHGGPAGLKAAAQEVAEWQARKAAAK